MATKCHRTGDLSSSSSSPVIPPKVTATPEPVDEDNVADLLDLLSRCQLIDLLHAAATSPSILAEIRLASDRLPTHRNLFAHIIDFSTTTATLTAAFATYDEIEDYRNVTDRFTSCSKGYNFVLFCHRSTTRLTLTEPQNLIGGRMTHCHLASSGNIKPDPNSNTMSGGDKSLRKIFIGNIQYDETVAS